MGELTSTDFKWVEAEGLPPVQTADDFRSLIGLHTVNVHPVEKNGTPYIGFEFGCTWDDEHGLGVLMHGTRVVEIGGPTPRCSSGSRSGTRECFRNVRSRRHCR